jgi:phage-related protein
MKWTIILHPKAVDEIHELPVDMRAKLTRLLHLVEEVGPFFLKQPHVKSLGNQLMEFRLQGKDGISRVIYAVITGKKVALLHAFIKKTQKTPQLDIMCALNRIKEMEK